MAPTFEAPGCQEMDITGRFRFVLQEFILSGRGLCFYNSVVTTRYLDIVAEMGVHHLEAFFNHATLSGPKVSKSCVISQEYFVFGQRTLSSSRTPQLSQRDAFSGYGGGLGLCVEVVRDQKANFRQAECLFDDALRCMHSAHAVTFFLQTMMALVVRRRSQTQPGPFWCKHPRTSRRSELKVRLCQDDFQRAFHPLQSA